MYKILKYIYEQAHANVIMVKIAMIMKMIMIELIMITMMSLMIIILMILMIIMMMKQSELGGGQLDCSLG